MYYYYRQFHCHLCDCAFLFPIFAMWPLFSLSPSHSSLFGNLKFIKNDLILMLSNIWECGYFKSTSSNFISKTKSIYFLLWKKREFTHLNFLLISAPSFCWDIPGFLCITVIIFNIMGLFCK